MFRVFRQLRLGDLPGQEHPTGLPADGSAADHPVPELEVILRPEIGLHQGFQTAVLGHGAADDLILRIGAEMSLGVLQLCQVEETVVAVIVLVLTVPGAFLLHLIVPAHAHAVLHGGEIHGASFAAMGQEHPLGRPVPHLQRMQIHVFFVGIDIEQQLCGVPDPGHGVEGMPPPDQGKIGHGVQLKQVRAGHPEEVSHHQVGVPYGLKLGKTVKHIKGILPLLGDLPVDRHSEGFKALVRVEPAHLNAAQVPQYRFVLGKADIDHIPAVPDRLPGKGLREHAEFRKLRDLPYHVISQADMIQYLIHLRVSAANFVKRCHSSLLFIGKARKKAGQ